jgi:hypothetical protein
MRTRWISLIFLFSLALGSCGGSATAGQSPDPLSSNPQEAITEEPSSVPSENPLQLSTLESADMPSNFPPVEKYVSIVKKDLASRLQIDEGKITLVKTEEKNWLNAALGCPSMGQFYAQGRVPGYQIWLEAEGMEYDYHTDLDGQVILCPDPTSPTPIIGVPID